MSAQATTATIEFSADVVVIDSTLLLRLPAEASGLLPSRGQVAVEATVDSRRSHTVLEPDGRKGHWLRLDPALYTAADVGRRVEVVVTVAQDWPEPNVPDDLRAALDGAPAKIHEIWQDITPMARWEWVRWVNATANPATRQRRVEVTISKIDHGKRRPCCFDLSACTDPNLARSGKLREPAASNA